MLVAYITHVLKEDKVSLRRLQSFIPIPTKMMPANFLLLPILDYVDDSFTKNTYLENV